MKSNEITRFGNRSAHKPKSTLGRKKVEYVAYGS